MWNQEIKGLHPPKIALINPVVEVTCGAGRAMANAIKLRQVFVPSLTTVTRMKQARPALAVFYQPMLSGGCEPCQWTHQVVSNLLVVLNFV